MKQSTSNFDVLHSLSVQRQIKPSTRNMSILTNISSNNKLTIFMVPENPPQTKSRMQIPSLFARAKRAIKINLASVPIIYRPPHPRFLEILEDAVEKHVISHSSVWTHLGQSQMYKKSPRNRLANNLFPYSRLKFQIPDATWDLSDLEIFLLL